jgi:hypothetical protein
MIYQTFVDELQARLYPDFYQQKLPVQAPFHFVLQKPSALPGGRYACALVHIEAQLDAQRYHQIRRQARRLTSSLWLLREVGLYLIIAGPAALWQGQLDVVRPDKTGLHAIIVQAVHCLDPESGASHLQQSAWGQLTFGPKLPIAEAISEVLAAYRAAGD